MIESVWYVDLIKEKLFKQIHFVSKDRWGKN